ncbi:hypothetical protein ABZS86_27710 [Streptomyces sp. NPDC005355]|uniref:hypothetical protein n=1 Tax=Streptomyces sp. NPDC005355 TaxID=3157038 RepID=UPI0033B4EB56
MSDQDQRHPGKQYPQPEFPQQDQPHPGATDEMEPRPDHGESSYQGHGLLEDRNSVITGGDSGIGRPVALAFAREGADVLFSYLPEEEEDAQETVRNATAWLALRVFLRLNGVSASTAPPPVSIAGPFIEEVAQDNIDVPVIAKRLSNWFPVS